MNENIIRFRNFIKTLSTERFDRYIGLAKGDDQYALKLYSANALLSEALYIPLQALEITLRNSVHNCLNLEFGEYWFDKPNVICFGNQLEMIGAAKSKLVDDKKEINSSRLVAELPFGFWTSMFRPGYDELWKKHLYKITLEEKRKGIDRKTYSGALEPIRKLRNRVAHHECIIKFNLGNHYRQMEFLTGLLSPEAKHWMKETSKFKQIYESQRPILAPLFEERKNDTGT